jgi:hypothetical protein
LNSRRRKDYGLVKITERDERLLGLIAEQFAITLPQLARLIECSERGARALRDRWQRAGWIAGGQVRLHGPVFIWLTSEGNGLAGERFKLWQPKLALLDHLAAVSDVRIRLEHEKQLGRWTSERALAQRHSSRSSHRPHIPDGVLQREERLIAVEVELSLKSRARRTAIVKELSRAYDEVWYFAARPCLPVLRELAESAVCQNVRVHEYAAPRATWAVAA